MSEHRFTPDQAGTGCAPSPDPRPRNRHNLRYESPAGKARTSPEGRHTPRTPSELTVVTCACGLATDALPSDDARLVYEEHRNTIRDESA